MKVAIGHIKNERASGVLYEEPYWTESWHTRQTGLRSFEGTCYEPAPDSLEVDLQAIFPGVCGAALVTDMRSENGLSWYAFKSIGQVTFSDDCGLVHTGRRVVQDGDVLVDEYYR